MIESFQDYMNRSAAAYKAENEIIADMLKVGINGLEWLVLNTLVDEVRIESLIQWVESVAVRLRGKEALELFIDAVHLDPDAFYDQHELNWHVTVDAALTYLSLLRESNYDRYFNLLQTIYKR
ncbi:hypothetical protein [Domibacillus tundrae]|uniref:hypothetical protein n=1 Tax=Domibacillus tundrae TaxID=1587527 RepID=UPI003399A569